MYFLKLLIFGISLYFFLLKTWDERNGEWLKERERASEGRKKQIWWMNFQRKTKNTKHISLVQISLRPLRLLKHWVLILQQIYPPFKFVVNIFLLNNSYFFNNSFTYSYTAMKWWFLSLQLRMNRNNQSL